MKLLSLLLCLGIAVVQASLSAPAGPGALPQVTYILGYSLAGDTITEGLLEKMDETLTDITGLLRVTWPEEPFETLLKEAVSGFFKALGQYGRAAPSPPFTLRTVFQDLSRLDNLPNLYRNFSEMSEPIKKLQKVVELRRFFAKVSRSLLSQSLPKRVDFLLGSPKREPIRNCAAHLLVRRNQLLRSALDAPRSQSRGHLLHRLRMGDLLRQLRLGDFKALSDCLFEWVSSPQESPIPPTDLVNHLVEAFQAFDDYLSYPGSETDNNNTVELVDDLFSELRSTLASAKGSHHLSYLTWQLCPLSQDDQLLDLNTKIMFLTVHTLQATHLIQRIGNWPSNRPPYSQEAGQAAGLAVAIPDPRLLRGFQFERYQALLQTAVNIDPTSPVMGVFQEELGLIARAVDAIHGLHPQLSKDTWEFLEPGMILPIIRACELGSHLLRRVLLYGAGDDEGRLLEALDYYSSVFPDFARIYCFYLVARTHLSPSIYALIPEFIEFPWVWQIFAKEHQASSLGLPSYVRQLASHRERTHKWLKPLPPQVIRMAPVSIEDNPGDQNTGLLGVKRRLGMIRIKREPVARHGSRMETPGDRENPMRARSDAGQSSARLDRSSKRRRPNGEKETGPAHHEITQDSLSSRGLPPAPRYCCTLDGAGNSHPFWSLLSPTTTSEEGQAPAIDDQWVPAPPDTDILGPPGPDYLGLWLADPGTE